MQVEFDHGWGPVETRTHDKGDIQQESIAPPQICLPESLHFAEMVDRARDM